MPPGAFWGDGCKGQIFKRQVGPWGALFLLKLLGASKPRLLTDTGPQVVARLNSKAGRL